MALPLPLVPFEEYMLLDDRPAYPMICFIRLWFLGQIEPAALNTAVDTVLPRHPLFQALVRQTKRGQWEWVAAGNLVLMGMDILGPQRPYTAVVFIPVRYAGRQSITLSYDTRPLSAEQAAALLELFARRIRETAAGASAEAQANVAA